MPLDPNRVSFKRAYEKNLITELLPDDTILVFRGDNETNYNVYRLTLERLIEPFLSLGGGGGGGIDHFKGVFTDFDTLSMEDGNLGDYAYVQNPTISRYDYGDDGWYIPRTTNSYLGDFFDEFFLPIDLTSVITNDFATITKPGNPAVLYIAYNDGNNVAWTKIGVANTDDLPEVGEPPTNLYFTPERVRHSFPRSDVVFSKPPTSGGEVYTATIGLHDQFKILSFSSSIPCRFRLYATSAYQTADELRTANTLPVGNHGCILDSALGVSNTDNFLVSPNILVSSDSPYTNEFFYTIDTLGGGDVAVDVTLEIVVISDDYFLA